MTAERFSGNSVDNRGRFHSPLSARALGGVHGRDGYRVVRWALAAAAGLSAPRAASSSADGWHSRSPTSSTFRRREDVPTKAAMKIEDRRGLPRRRLEMDLSVGYSTDERQRAPHDPGLRLKQSDGSPVTNR